MRMRAADRNALSLDALLFGNRFNERLQPRATQPNGINAQQQMRCIVSVSQRHRADVKRCIDANIGMITVTVSAHSHRFVRRDVDLGESRSPWRDALRHPTLAIPKDNQNTENDLKKQQCESAHRISNRFLARALVVDRLITDQIQSTVADY